MLLIPSDRLDAEVLTALIEAFILQEGTDYGQRETDLLSKVTQVRGQIDKGKVLITYDEETETCTLMTRQKYQQYAEVS